MKKVFLFAVFAAIAFGIYWFKFRKTASGPEAPKQAPLGLKKHSEIFNKSVA